MNQSADISPPIIGIDPGPKTSGLVLLHADCLAAIVPCAMNSKIKDDLRHWYLDPKYPAIVAIEDFRLWDVRGEDCLETIKWIGVFRDVAQEQKARVIEIPRATIRSELCNRTQGIGDPQIAAALRDWARVKWALPSSNRRDVVGRTKARGPLYGIKEHAWAALAVAVVCGRMMEREGTDLLCSP